MPADFAQGVDFGAAFKGSAPPNALETLNTLGQLNERRAQTQLYNLDAAIKQRDFNLLQQHGPNAFLGDEQAQTALSQSPQLLNQVLTARGQGVKNSLDTMNLQTHAKAVAAQYLNPFIGTPQFQTEALRVIQMLAPQIGPAGAQQLADIAVRDPQKLQALIQANLPSNDFETVTGVTGRTANRVEFERKRALEGAEPPVAGPPMQGADPNNPSAIVSPILPKFNPNAPPPPGPTMGPQSSAAPPQGQLQAQLVNGLTNATQPIPPNAWTARIFGDEANNVATAANPNSSAKGLGQFIKSTWLDQMDKLHPELADKMSEQQILALRTDKTQGAALNQEATMGLAKDNADYLQSKNLPVTSATLAMAHKLGAQGAEKVLAAAIANPNTPMTSILSQIDPDSIRANPGWARMTVGAFINSNLQKYGNGPVGDLGQTQPPTGAAASPLAQAASEPVAQAAAAQDTIQPGQAPAIAPTPVVASAPQAQPIPTDMAPAAQGGPVGAPPLAAAPTAGPQVAQAGPPGMATPLGFGAPQLSEEQKLGIGASVKGAQDQYDEAQKAGTGATSGLSNVHLLQNAFDKFQTGKGSEALLDINRWYISAMQGMGISLSPQELEWAANGQLIYAQGANLAFDRVRSLGAREAVQVVQQVMSIKPNLLNTPEGNKLILDAIKQDFQRSIDRYQFMDKWNDGTNHTDYRHAAATFDREHPAIQYASRVTPMPKPAEKADLVPNTIYDMPKSDNHKGGRLMWDGDRFVSPVDKVIH